MTEQVVTDEREDLALKLSIEAGLIVLLRRLFVRIGEDYKTVYTATGQVLDASVYDSELTGVLRPSYRKGADKTGKEIRRNAEIIYPQNNRDVVNNQIDLNLLNFIEKEPVERARIINRTTERQLNQFTIGAIIAAALAGISPTNAEVADAASKRFVKRSKSRSSNIAITETLNATEGPRLIEANTLSENNIQVQDKKKEEPPKFLDDALFRYWITRLDARVRLTHQEAHGQRVPGTATPFRVGNSLLMYPGDISLDADIEEISGCRCYAATVMVY